MLFWRSFIFVEWPLTHSLTLSADDDLEEEDDDDERDDDDDDDEYDGVLQCYRYRRY